MKTEMTLQQAYNIINNEFTLKDKCIAPCMEIDTVRGAEVSAAFILFCKEKGYL